MKNFHRISTLAKMLSASRIITSGVNHMWFWMLVPLEVVNTCFALRRSRVRLETSSRVVLFNINPETSSRRKRKSPAILGDAAHFNSYRTECQVGWAINYGGVERIRTAVHGFADRCLTTRPPRHKAKL